jgi:hypothetical protein
MRHLLALGIAGALLVGQPACGQRLSVPRPAPVGIIYFRADCQPGTCVWHRMDWTGRSLSDVRLAGQIEPSPDGAKLIETIPDVAGYMLQITDGQGRVLASGRADNLRDLTWSSDGANLCAIRDAPEWGGADHELEVTAIGQSPSQLIDLGSSRGQPGFAACSVERNRAVVVDAVHEHDQTLHPNHAIVAARVRAYSLTGHAVSFERTYPVGDPATEVFVRASLDGSRLGEVRRGGSDVLDLPSGHLVASYPGWQLLGFTFDGKRAVLTQRESLQAATSIRIASTSEVVDVASGGVVWNSSFDLTIQAAVAAPGSEDLLLAGAGTGLSELYVIGPDGSERHIASNVSYLPPCPCPGNSAT